MTYEANRADRAAAGLVAVGAIVLDLFALAWLVVGRMDLAWGALAAAAVLVGTAWIIGRAPQ